MSKEFTNAEVLSQWKAGESVWSVEMGGIGPNYELAIQKMAFTMFEAMERNPIELAKVEPEGRKYVVNYLTRIDREPDVMDVVKRVGPSGAQYSAAQNIAYMFHSIGYAAALDSADKSRHILVSNVDLVRVAS